MGGLIVLILAALAISTTFAALPMDQLLDEISTDVEMEVIAAAGTCSNVCYKDKCKGTWTNPIPRGKTWHKIKSSYKGGCCAFGHGKCDLCCSKTDSPTAKPTRPPTRPPTARPTAKPTAPPTHRPTAPPTKPPTHPPTKAPTWKMCKNVCYKDKCKGTWTNPIPRGKAWTTVSSKYKGGCCAFGHGKCDKCCTA